MFSHNKKGQSALEYLMTYGWALVVIVVVIAALVVLVGNPGGNATCNASGNAFNVRNQQLTAATGWTLKVSNLTGRNLNTVAPASAPSWNPAVGTPLASQVTVPATITTGQEFDITAGTPGTLTTSGKYQTIINLTYNDGDFTRTTAITCNGTAN